MMQGWEWYGNFGWMLAGGILCLLLIVGALAGLFFLIRTIIRMVNRGRFRPGTLPAVLMMLALTSVAGADLSARTIFVPNASDGTVSAVDTARGRELWQLQVSEAAENRPAEAAHGIAISRDGATLFVGDAVRDELVVVDVASRRISERIAVSHAVHGIDISPDGRTVWVGGANEDRFWLGELTVVDTRTLSIIGVVNPGVGSAAHVSFAPTGDRVWVASTTTNGVWVVDSGSFDLVHTIPLIPEMTGGSTGTPEGAAGYIGINEVAVSPDGTRAYAIGPEASILFAIDTATREVVGKAQGQQRAHGVVVSPDGSEVWVANRSGSVSVFNAATLQQPATIRVGDYANHVAFDETGRTVFVTGRDSVIVIDATTRSVVQTIPVGRDPHEIAIGPPSPRVMLTGGRPEGTQPREPEVRRVSPSPNLVPVNDPHRALALANDWKTRFPSVTTYVTSEMIRFMFPDGQVVDVPMPEDTMMVAAAPYMINTHPCTVHTMSGCQGELRNEPIEVTVFDEHDQIFLQSSARSLQNGFVELWLPRDRRFRVRFEARGRAVEGPIETFDGSPTCITDLQL